MSVLILGLVSLIGLIFSIAVAVCYMGCLGASMAAFNKGRIVWGSVSFFVPPVSFLYALRHRDEAGWSFGFMWKGGAVALLLAGGVWLGMQLLPMPQHNTGQLMEHLLPKPAEQASAPAQAGPVQQ